MKKLNFEKVKPYKDDEYHYWVAEPYKIVHYDYLTKGNMTIEKKHFCCYKRIMDYRSGKMLFGNHVSRDINKQDYETFEQAAKVCQDDFNTNQKGD